MRRWLRRSAPGVVELMDEKTVQDFWQNHACGDAWSAACGSASAATMRSSSPTMTSSATRSRRHLPACLDALNVSGKRVLEIGLGQGADSESLIRRAPAGPAST